MSLVFWDLHSCSRSSSSSMASSETSSLSRRLSIAEVLWKPNLRNRKNCQAGFADWDMMEIPPEHKADERCLDCGELLVNS